MILAQPFRILRQELLILAKTLIVLRKKLIILLNLATFASVDCHYRLLDLAIFGLMARYFRFDIAIFLPIVYDFCSGYLNFGAGINYVFRYFANFALVACYSLRPYDVCACSSLISLKDLQFDPAACHFRLGLAIFELVARHFRFDLVIFDLSIF